MVVHELRKIAAAATPLAWADASSRPLHDCPLLDMTGGSVTHPAVPDTHSAIDRRSATSL